MMNINVQSRRVSLKSSYTKQSSARNIIHPNNMHNTKQVQICLRTDSFTLVYINFYELNSVN